jgi:hypothetical protein
MKKQNLLLVLLFAATQLFAQNVPNYVPTNGLVGWWPFNNNANDESGNGNNGTVNGATLTSDRNGNVNKAYSFDGINDQINIPSSNSIVNFPNGQSISFWMKISAYPVDGKEHYIIDKTGASGTAKYYQVCISDYLNSDVLFYRYGESQSVSSQGTLMPFSNILLNQWIHVCYITDLTSTKTYLNGVLFQTYNMYSSIGQNIDPLIFGNTSLVNPTNSPYNGQLDDIGIWNRVLTPQEVTALYNSCSNTTATITPQSSTTFCQGGNVALQASSGSSYSWSNGATTQSITVTQGNTYTVTVTDGNSCTASASQVITVNPNPTVSLSLPTITNLGAVPFVMNGNPSGGTYTGAGVSGNSFNPANAGLGLKSVSYNYTNGNGCSGSASSTTLVYDTAGVVCTSYDTITTTINDTITTFVSVTDTLLIDVTITGLTPPNNTNTVKVYPNPANNALFINNGNLASMAGYSIKITNSLGQIFFNEPVNQQQFFIDISTWATGTYLLYVIDPQQAVVETKQVVLQ